MLRRVFVALAAHAVDEGGGLPFLIQPDMVAPLVMEPRVLIVRIASGHFAALMVVAHGPCDSGSPDAIEVACAFWASLQIAIGNGRRRNEGLFVMVDANAQLYGPPVAAHFANPIQAVR